MDLAILGLIFGVFFGIILMALTYMDKDMVIIHSIVFVGVSIAWGVFAAYLLCNYESEYALWVNIVYFAVAPIIIWFVLTLVITFYVPSIGFFGALLFAGLGWWSMGDTFGFTGNDLGMFGALAVFSIVMYVSFLGSMLINHEI